MSPNNLYNSYFSTVSADRRSPPKQSTSTPTEPPKKLSKSFQRQLAKTLAPPGKKNKAKKKRLASQAKRKSKTSAAKMSKRAAATDSSDAKATSSKKAKTSSLPEMERDKEDQPFWEISGKRRLQLSEFKGTTMIGVREFYEKDGEALPGKKGISMTVEQFDTIVRLLPEIERQLKGKGLQLARPKYGQEDGEVEGEVEAVDGVEKDDEDEDDDSDGDAKAKVEEEEEE